MRDALTVLQQRLEDVRGTAVSDDGLISVTVGGRGALIDLVIDPRVYRVPDARRLAGDIKTTIRLATEAVHDQGFELTKSLLPRNAKREDTDVRFGPALHQLDRMAGGAR
jgi:DNA-binding protein YbaB